jgi:hypothetical protein
MKILSLLHELLHVERQGRKDQLTGNLVDHLYRKPIIPKQLNSPYI